MKHVVIVGGGFAGLTCARTLASHSEPCRYAFSLPEAVTRGELRLLRNPADALEEVA